MTEKIIYLEPHGGIAGDMFLAAAIDAGVSLSALTDELSKLHLPGWKILTQKSQRHHVGGTHLNVITDAKEKHSHRRYSDIIDLIEKSSLSPRTQSTAQNIFKALGEVEARIHQTSIDDLHFHEVGAVDSIVDICGAAIVLELLDFPKVFCAAPPLGSGSLTIAHGTVPIPVPATLELLKNLPVRFEGVGELTTPTGAALVKVLTTVMAPPPMNVERVGYGLGTQDFKDRANVLRLSIGQKTQTSLPPNTEEIVMLETNIDDENPQVLAQAVKTLHSMPVLDVWTRSVNMKKNRHGIELTVLVNPENESQLVTALFKHVGTLGIRRRLTSRYFLDREWRTAKTDFGEVRIKMSFWEQELIRAQPEFEDCQALALKHDVPVREVLRAAEAAAQAFKRS